MAAVLITPVVPTRLCDAHFYTMGPHIQLHHLDYVILQRHHQMVHSFQQEQLTFWTQVHRDTGRLMHMTQPAHTKSPGWPSRFSLRHCRRSSQRTYVHSQLCHSPFETSPRNTSTSQKPNTLGLHPQPSFYAEDHSSSQHLIPDSAEQKALCRNRSMRLSSEPQTSE